MASYAPKTWEDIASIVFSRRNARGPLLNAMMEVRERYNGDWVLPDLGMDSKPVTPSIIADAIDHNGLRAAQVMPDIVVPALDGTKPTSRNRANNRRKALLYTWERSELNLHLRRAYRHLFGYATTTLVVEPDFDHECAVIKVRDPLHAFPEPKAAEDLTPPSDCAFVYGKSAEWICRMYPEQAREAGVDPRRQSSLSSDLWDIAEWIDEDWIVLGVLGPRVDHPRYTQETALRPFELRRWPNRAGRCTVVTPQRVTLDKVASAVANATGIADLQARLTALHLVALEKSIVPDTYIVGSSSSPPRLVGEWKDGRSGDINELLDVTNIGQLRQTPDQTALLLIDRLERIARTNTGTVPAFQGESFGGARTGRGLDALLATAVDPRIQEAQEIMQARLTDVNRVVADTLVGYWPAKRYEVFTGWTTDPELTKFTPEVEFGETNENKVVYAMPGTDMVGLTVSLGQLNGMEAMSKDTLRRLHPFIKDADGESRRILTEKLSAAMEMQLLTRASDPAGGLTPIDLAAIAKAVAQGKGLAEAIEDADRAARERQAAMAPPPDEGMALPPEMMAGLANPGEGAEMQPPPSIGPPPSGLANLDSLLGALASPVGPTV